MRSARIRRPRAFSGIEVAKIRLRLFVLSGAMSALAGVVYTLRFTSARGDNGEGFELSVIAAVLFGGVSIFGGRGSMIGVLLSLLIIGVLKNALTLDDVSSETLTVVTGVLLLASVLIPNLVARWRAARDRRFIAKSASRSAALHNVVFKAVCEEKVQQSITRTSPRPTTRQETLHVQTSSTSHRHSRALRRVARDQLRRVAPRT